MAFAPAFTIGITINPAQIVITDTSTGSDVAITGRKILLYTVTNALLATLDFPLSAGSSITVSPLTQDVALNVVVNWINVGNAILYTSSQIYPFTGYSESYYYGLTQSEATNPGIVQSQTYLEKKSQLRTYIDDATQSISIGNDLGNSEAAILRAQYIIANANLWFN